MFGSIKKAINCRQLSLTNAINNTKKIVAINNLSCRH